MPLQEPEWRSGGFQPPQVTGRFGLRRLEATTTCSSLPPHSLILLVSQAAEPIYNPRLDLTAVADRFFSVEV